jgi:AraC-like DNA-binding protein
VRRLSQPVGFLELTPSTSASWQLARTSTLAIAVLTTATVVQISSMVIQALAAAVERAGHERSRFIAEAGLDPAQLSDMHARIPLEQYRRVVRTAYALSGDPAFGLRMGARMAMGSFDVLGHLVEQSASLRDALMVAVRYSRIVSEGSRLVLEEQSESATVRLLLPEDDGPEARLASEFAMTALWRTVQGFVGDDALPRHAFFTYSAPAHHAAYAEYFGGREQFAHAFTGLEFERVWLDRTRASVPSDLRDYLLTRAELLLAKANPEALAAERVRRWLAAQTDLVRPTLGLVARELGIRSRSLRHHLHAEKVQFSALLDEARATQAKRLLADRTRSIQDAAYALGFRRPSAFSRAFKRWTGMAPKDYRPAR